MSATGIRRGVTSQDASINPRQRRLRRGERRRLTREDISADIRKKEEELTNLLETRNALKKSGRDQRAVTLRAYQEKDLNQAEVDRSYKDISAKSEEMNRIKAVLIYQRAERHDDAIRRIKDHLNFNNLKLSDENRLVQEIDSLNKSKRNLTKYQQMRASIDEMRARQRMLKSQRDALFEKIKLSKKEEEVFKKKGEGLLASINQLKSTIEELQQRRQQLEIGASSSSGDEGCPPGDAAERPEAGATAGAAGDGGGGGEATIEIEFEDFDDNPEPDGADSRELVALCRSLTTYLRNLLPGWAAVAAAGASGGGGGDVGRPSPPSRLPLAPPDVESPAQPLLNLLSPSASAAAVSALSGPNALPPQDQRRRRPLGRKLQRSERVLTHQPEVFAQFGRFGMQPPARVAEIPDCLQRLAAFLDAEEASGGGGESREKTPKAAEADPPPPPPPVGYARSLSNPSNDESGFSETTSVRPESPELGTGTRCAPPPTVLAGGLETEREPGAPLVAGAGHDDLLSTSSTICSEENVPSISTESPPLPTA